LSNAEYNSAAGALSLLPTAGALIGAPTKELWMVFKLMPLAGVLAMLLSLGGTVVPSEAGEYDPNTSFSFGGMVATEQMKRKQPGAEEDGGSIEMSDAEKFKRKVIRRSEVRRGGGSYGTVWIGILLQLALLAILMITLYYGEEGGVIVWWCGVSFIGC
jgi:hypothetical protein